MTDEQLREVHGRITAIRRREGLPDDHYYACVILSDLSAVPFPRVWEACLDAEDDRHGR